MCGPPPAERLGDAGPNRRPSARSNRPSSAPTMTNIPIRRKRFLGLPVWFIPALIGVSLLTGWFVLADDDQPETDVIEAGPAYATVPEVADEDLGLPAERPAGTAAPVVVLPSGAPPSAGQTEAAYASGAAAGAAAASRAILASTAEVGQTIRASSVAGALRGQQVRIAGARVSEVLSERAFTVGTGADRVMVLVDPTGQGVSGVQVGQTVTLAGALETYAPGMSASGIPDAGESGYVVVTAPGGVTR